MSELKRVLERASNHVAAESTAGFTRATAQTEWNLAHRLAMRIHRQLRDLNCDCDVTKPDFGQKRPDIIFHLRNTHRRNFLVVETKRDGRPGVINAEIKKVKDNWFKSPLRYRFGSVVNLRADGTADVILFRNPFYVRRHAPIQRAGVARKP